MLKNIIENIERVFFISEAEGYLSPFKISCLLNALYPYSRGKLGKMELFPLLNMGKIPCKFYNSNAKCLPFTG